MSVDIARRSSLLGVLEHRAIVKKFEFRTDAITGMLVFEGYASTYDPYDCYGGPRQGGWIEQIDTRAFDQTLAGNPDVQLLINHDGLPLARTVSGTLALRKDSHGLHCRALLDPSDPDVQRIAPKMKRGDLDEMSFGFRVTEQDWSDDFTKRTIRNLNLDMGDVSIVNHGMNPNTSAVLSAGVEALASLSQKQLVELRSMDQQMIQRAAATLARATGGRPVTRFADPGYRPDGRSRYPLDSEERVRNAWHYINMARNASRYTTAQLADITGSIRAAAQDFGVRLEQVKRSTPTSPIAKQQWPTPAPLDPHDDAYTKEDLGEMDDQELHGKAAPAPDTEAGQAFRSHDEDCEDAPEDRGENPFAKSKDDEGEDDEDGDDGEERTIDLGLAAALDSTIVSCLNLAGDSPQLRTLLDRARRQLSEMRGKSMPPAPKTSVDAKFDELRRLSGVSTTSNVEECLAALRSM